MTGVLCCPAVPKISKVGPIALKSMIKLCLKFGLSSLTLSAEKYFGEWGGVEWSSGIQVNLVSAQTPSLN